MSMNFLSKQKIRFFRDRSYIHAVWWLWLFCWGSNLMLSGSLEIQGLLYDNFFTPITFYSTRWWWSFKGCLFALQWRHISGMASQIIQLFVQEFVQENSKDIKKALHYLSSAMETHIWFLPKRSIMRKALPCHGVIMCREDAGPSYHLVGYQNNLWGDRTKNISIIMVPWRGNTLGSTGPLWGESPTQG